MEAFDIHDGIPGREEVVGQQQRLVHVTAGIITDVKNQVRHPLLHELERGLVALLEGGAGEFTQPEIPHGVPDHEGGIYAVYGYFSAGNLEGYLLRTPLDRNGDLGAGRTFHPAHHAVLRELDAGNHFVVHLQQTVTHLQAHLFRRAAGDHFQDNSGVIGHIELNADTVEITRKFLFRITELLRRQVHRMRVQLGEGRHDGGIRHPLPVEGVHIVLFHHVQHQIELAPIHIFGAQQMLGFPVADNPQCNKGTDDDAQNHLYQLNEGLFFHCACST